MTELSNHPNVRIPPPVLTLIHLLAAFLLGWLVPFPLAVPTWLVWIGWLFLVSGLAVAFSAVRQFSQAHTTLDPHGSVSALVMNGPYRFSRNPIYLGFLLTLIGLPLTQNVLWGVVLAFVFVPFMVSLVIQHEEAYLDERFGSDYISYKLKVRRWL